MKSISLAGNKYVLILIVFLFFAGYNYKKGLIVLKFFMWAAILTLFLKNSIDYPRPLAIDPGLKSFGSDTGTNHTSMQPEGFFELFSHDLLLSMRNSKTGRFGFPPPLKGLE